MSPRFNLLSEPWVQCQALDGSQRVLGIRAVLLEAPKLRRLANESPLVNAAIRRLLLAVLHRCFGPKNNAAWERLWQGGAWGAKELNEYCEAQSERFWLWHPRYPFYQQAGLVKQSANYEKGRKPARELIAEQSSYGVARALFEGRPDGEATSLSPAAAARWLTAIQAFHPGGLLTRDRQNGDPTAAKSGLVYNVAVTTLTGNNLFETLALNLAKYPANSGFPATPEDCPAWEREPEPKHTSRVCCGLLDLYTWQARRIELFADAQGNVAEFLLLAGATRLGGEKLRDPMAAYKAHSKHGWVPLAFSEERALWRDSVALVQQGGAELKRPLVVDHVSQQECLEDRPLVFQVEGQVAKQAKIFLACAETIPLPPEYLKEGALVGDLRSAMQHCEAAEGALREGLRVALQNVALGGRSLEGQELRDLLNATQAVPRFWAAMKAHFERLVEELAKQPPDEREATCRRFQDELRTEVDRHYAAAVVASTTRARMLKGLCLGQRSLSLELKKKGLGREPRLQRATESEGSA